MLNDRLKNRRLELGFTQQKLSDMTGIKKNTISNYENGVSSPNETNICLLMKALKCDANYLFEWEESKEFVITLPEKETIKKYRILDEHGKSVVDSVLEIEHERCTQILQAEEEPEPKVPTWSVCYNEYKVSAGTGVMLDEYERLDRIDVIDTPEARRADYALMISGNSMEPEYHDGDIILVEHTVAVDVGEIGIFVIDGEGYIKEYGGDRLISLNEDYDDIILHDYDSIHCCGRVIGTAELPE